MRVLLTPCGSGPLCALWVCVAVALCGCGRTAPSPAESARLDTEYVAVEDRERSTILTLAPDGTFSVREEEHERYPEPVMQPEPAPLATGTWVYADGGLELQGDGWTARYEADSTRVAIPARADTRPRAAAAPGGRPRARGSGSVLRGHRLDVLRSAPGTR